jgi:hypothetical protein
MALPVTIDWDQLIKRMRENLNSYWGGWTRRPDAFREMLFDLGIQSGGRARALQSRRVFRPDRLIQALGGGIYFGIYKN